MPLDILPICLNLKHFNILVVGAGPVAAQKLRTLLKWPSQVTVIAKEPGAAVRGLAKAKKLRLKVRAFRDSDIKGFSLIYACTNNIGLNRKIAWLSKRQQKLVNVASNPLLSNFISPAVYKKGRLAIAVSTSGANPPLAVSLRDAIGKSLNKKQR